ncbi:MAG: tyrosine--tRNA ligase [Patescibacteria group bacterium]
MGHVRSLPSELLMRGVQDIVVRESFEAKLRSGKKLRIKHGVDPTTDRLHIGHGTIYWKLRQFQELGHVIVFLIGDFTARFGDPDKLVSREMQSKDQTDAKAATYLDQIKGILDLSKTEIRRNSEWYDKMSAEDLIRLVSNFSVAQLLERDMFVKRQKDGVEIGYHEPIYPVLQGYDSVMLNSDLTVIGTDQFFNEMMARPLQERARQTSQDIMTLSLLLGTDGRKMSKTFPNSIAILDTPEDKFGKVMRIPDELIGHYFELATQVSNKELAEITQSIKTGELLPRDAKMRLARTIVAMYHGTAVASTAEEAFIRIFRDRALPSEIVTSQLPNISYRLDDLLIALKFVSSRAAAQRSIGAGSVHIDEAVVTDWKIIVTLNQSHIIQYGKRLFRRIEKVKN